MFDKILIANRGEIACRVIATARRMGVRTVAVHSDADAAARHVAWADESVRIGPAAAAESYLRGDAILEAAARTGAQAIHPGYGFLSENPDFVEAAEAAGLAFIGPPASAIRAMGLKDAAKALMEEAGVPVVPGYHGENQDPAFLAGCAEEIGYPVLIKARAGGGGKGMRLVERPADFAEALDSARNEALKSFGDPAVLVEKFVASPRHVEIQVFADGHGNVVHLFERDCSLQRRHQKVIEEAPAPGMTEEVRAAMGAAAVEAARAIGYRGAGTVEFIADGSRGLRADGFWFMEMNTRLQVEHPVTEAITGLDLVELQLRVAAGEPLPFAQEALAIDGHAFEARLYAEDVPKGFLPATGRLAHLAFPPEAAAFAPGAARIDSGVEAGDEISPWYDPMIAKVIVHGADRRAALRRLSAALSATEVAGTVTNIAFLHALAGHAGFAAGEVDTGLIGRDLEALSAAAAPPPEAAPVAALALAGMLDPAPSASPFDRLRFHRNWGAGELVMTLERDGEETELRLEVEGRPGALTLRPPSGEALSVLGLGDEVRVGAAGGFRRLRLTRSGMTATIFLDGRAFAFERVDPLVRAEAAETGGDAVAAPMPGLIARVSARPGDAVRAGDPLLVLEAMKMEHTLRAPRDGVVAEIRVEAGGQVADGDVLVVLEDAAA